MHTKNIWITKAESVKIVPNKLRTSTITVYSAIGAKTDRPPFVSIIANSLLVIRMRGLYGVEVSRNDGEREKIPELNN